MAYTPYGPFVNGAAPGIQASFLNGVETFLVSVNNAAIDTNVSSDLSGNLTIKGLAINSPVTTIAGNSGTISLWEFHTGTFKQVFMWFNNYQNTSGSKQRITLPTPFVTGGMATIGDIHVPSTGYGIYIVDSGGTTRNWHVFNGFNSVVSQQLLPCFSTGEFTDNMKYVDIDNGSTGSAFGWIWIAGV